MATIRNEAQLQQAIEQIQGLCSAIDTLRTDIFPKNLKNFAIMAEGPVDEIHKLQADIDAYIQHLEASGTPVGSGHVLAQGKKTDRFWDRAFDAIQSERPGKSDFFRRPQI